RCLLLLVGKVRLDEGGARGALAVGRSDRRTEALRRDLPRASERGEAEEVPGAATEALRAPGRGVPARLDAALRLDRDAEPAPPREPRRARRDGRAPGGLLDRRIRAVSVRHLH